jgi:hypothetical protein
MSLEFKQEDLFDHIYDFSGEASVLAKGHNMPFICHLMRSIHMESAKILEKYPRYEVFIDNTEGDRLNILNFLSTLHDLTLSYYKMMPAEGLHMIRYIFEVVIAEIRNAMKSYG